MAKTYLKRYAVPPCNLPTKSESDLKKNNERLQRRFRRSENKKTIIKKKKANKLIENHASSNSGKKSSLEVSSNQLEEAVCDNTSEVIVESQYGAGNVANENYSLCNRKDLKDVGTNVTLLTDESCFVQLIRTDAELSTATGIESFEILDTIVDMVKYIYGDRYEADNMKMETRNRIVSVYTKLKQNLRYSLLAIMFRLHTAKHIQRIFEEMIQVLASVLKVSIPWPSREQIRSNLPKCFAGFEDTRIVLDCTEVYIRSPKEICCQVMTYSHYKSHVTVKVMTGVSPSGTITFLSKIYGGRVSDASIFQQSDLVTKLEPGNGLMVDRGILIDELCQMNRWKLIRPPFSKDKQQFSEEEAALTSKIASARVHIERSNQRIKNLKILGSIVLGNLVVLLEEIFTVICATINMSSPILKDDKFMTD